MHNRIILLIILLTLLMATVVLVYMHPMHPATRKHDQSKQERLNQWQQEMQSYFSKQDYYAARRKARQILYSFPNHPDALYMKSRLCCRDGKYDEALNIYNRMLRNMPHDIISRNNAALLTLLLQKRYADAEVQLRKALITAPAQPVILYNLQIISKFRGLPPDDTATDQLPPLPDVQSHPNMLYIMPGKLVMYEAPLSQGNKEMP